MTKRQSVALLLLISCALLLSACRSNDGPPEYIYRGATVESIDVSLNDNGAYTLVEAHIRGSLPDTCTLIDSVTQDMRGNVFILTLRTERRIDAVCEQTVMPFEAIVPLAIEGLQCGVYAVSASNITTTFELEEEDLVPFE